MTQKAKTRDKEKEKDEELSLQQLQGHLDILDQRLDALDTMITAIAERVMSQPITLVVTCPNCGSSIEVALMGSEKMRR